VLDRQVASPAVPEPADDALGSLHGRLNDFTPESQQLRTIPRDTQVVEALTMMRLEGFSQLPVMHNERLVGVFSYRSFARRLLELDLGAGVDVLRLSVADVVDDLPLMPPDQDVEAAIAAVERDDAVLVRDRDGISAIVTASDLLVGLRALTRPFVLLMELERSLRAIVDHALPAEQLEPLARQILANAYKGREDDLPTTTSDMTFGDLVSVVRDGRAWTDIGNAIGGSRDIVGIRLGPIPGIRNTVLHFRRALSPDEDEKLVAAHEWVGRQAVTLGLLDA